LIRLARCDSFSAMKKLLCAVLILGWIPTLAIVCGARWMSGESLLAQGRTPIKVTRLFTGPDGKTHVEEHEIPLKPQGRGTELSDTVAVTGLQFRTTNQDYNLDWHPAPRRQYVVTLSGESEVELDGGRKIRLGPGHILLAEDTTGAGHISRAVGSADRVSLFITLADTPPPR
jgi:quercetin dioxygenase-like cupin family protein